MSRKAGNSKLVYDKGTRTILKKTADQVLADQVLAAYDATDRHIGDSDLDDEQPVSLHVRTTLGDIRFFRRVLAMQKRGAELAAAEKKAREDYDASL